MNKRISVGKEDFRAMIEENSYYVDKTMLIKEIADSGTMVTLFTRPRRFGKTLNLSMIRRFFEDERTPSGEKIDNGHLFRGLAIENCGPQYLSMQQQYPVIKLSLKSAKQPDYETAYKSLIDEIAGEFKRHIYATEGNALRPAEKEQFEKFCDKKAEYIDYAKALKFLCECLEKYHSRKVIILIDEYDVPLENAWFRKFYDEMIAFIRSLFESALKTNDSLKFGVITGCLRISKESIFTGLNNLKVNSVRANSFGEYFGFLQEEVDEILDYYGISDWREEVRRWYDGYQFGNWEIYNPWSILSFVEDLVNEDTKVPRPYWLNTSSNDIVRKLVENADEETKAEMEQLISGGTIEKPVHEEITYDDIYKSMDNLWNFLYFTGYLRSCGERLDEAGEQVMVQLAIPNKEIKTTYKGVIKHWFKEKIENTEREHLYHAVLSGDAESFAKQVTGQLCSTISFFDYAENYYHGFLAGLLQGMPGYRVISNRESGDGRPDLILRESEFAGKVIILELKVADKFAEMEAKCEEALAQIETGNYARPFMEEGCQEILKYGVCFFKKGCRIKAG